MTSAQAGTVLRHLRQRPAGPAEPPDAQLLERFAADRDQAAFAALVRRHGPMVLGVCRSVLRHEQDAEDAFQATFLVLARKAGSVRRPGAVAGWLYEIAHHVAARAQAAAARRRTQERKATPMPPADPTLDMTLRDLHRVLHRELRRLPEKYRLPLVLCYLEGRSHEEAAAQLGWSRGTFRGRLDRGREHLRRRLAARGLALSGLLCAAAVGPKATAEGLVGAAVRAATGAPEPRASALADAATRAMLAGKLKGAAAIVLLACAAAGAFSLTAGAQPPPSPKSEAPQPAPASARPPAAPAANDEGSVSYSGSVLGPDGKPVAGAKLYLTHQGGYFRRPDPAPECGTAGPDGRFSVAPPAKFDERWGTVVVATAAGFGPGWVTVGPGAARGDLTIRLVTDDLPITGQVVNLEGKPIPGVSLTTWQIHAAPDEDAGPWVKDATTKTGLALDLEKMHFRRYATALCPTVTTDAGGRFRLPGIGRNRLVHAILEGPTIASQLVCILTRPGKPIDVVSHKGNREYGEADTLTTYYGADFRLVAAPCQPVVGVVRDADTKKPIPGATVCSHSQRLGPSRFRGVDPDVRTTADAEGRYRLLGLPTGKGYSIAVVPGKDQPYVPRHVDVPEGVGVGPVTVDIELKRGVWIEGKITDKVTGKPLKAGVEYFSRYANPHLREFPGYDGTILRGDLVVAAKEDGSYRVIGLPGPGLVCVFNHMEPYLRAPDREDEFGTTEESLESSPYHISFTINYNAIARVDPAKGADAVRCDVTIDPGWTFKAKVEGPDGKPLAGGQSCNLNGTMRWDREPMKSPEFAGRFNPRHPRGIVVRHPENELVGVAQPPKENGGTVGVKLRPGAAVTGRLVGPDGKPRGGASLELSFRPEGWGGWHDYWPSHIQTDPDGRFRIGALLPGYEFRLSDGMGEVVIGPAPDSGQTKDQGDVRTQRNAD
ncbi:MAG TPA: sigma-70 family RNA polymerase sigma factor [Gemmataceae bacterium]|nr:sigma-70 family RNA polymerase sigma factor [Gemmataceae bacterium]